MQTTQTLSPKQIQKIIRKLKVITQERPDVIRAFVAQEALDYADNPIQMFIDLSNCGCQGGTIGSLIYYADTHAFFDCYYDEIEELREDYENNTGESLRINSDLKNFLAWFAFEEAAYQMATNDLELEI